MRETKVGDWVGKGKVVTAKCWNRLPGETAEPPPSEKVRQYLSGKIYL